ncbi:MAG: polyphosphate kinase [Moraxellaceae bacterium]|jgi:PPK2 family polyphosphate:nucleotide phosphotransferase|nr:polyphosphate kinase [Moraxellaceae bacterium]
MPAVSPASPAFDLAVLPTAPPPEADEDAARATADALREELATLQELLYANRRHALLVVLQGLDASGKDNTIKRVLRTLSPSGLAVHAFRMPEPQELAHDFLWRVHARVPARGMIGVFNRSHYEAVVSDVVQGLCSETERQQRLQSIRDFERHLAASGTLVCKFFLHVGREEQRRRLQARISDPTKQWKLGPDDLEVRRRFPEYESLWSGTMAATDAVHAPWHVIPADRKGYRDLRVLTVLVDTLRALEMRYPVPARRLRPEDVPD